MDCLSNVEVVRRSLDDLLVDGLVLLSSTISGHPDAVRNRVVSSLDVWIDTEKTAQVQFCLRLDLHIFKRAAHHTCIRHISHQDAGIERRHEKLLRIRRRILAKELQRLIGDNRKLTGYFYAIHEVGFHSRLTSSLPLPLGGHFEPDETFRLV